MKKPQKNGQTSRAGRPLSNYKTITVRCLPEVIPEVRKFAKLKSLEHQISNDNS